MRAVTLKDERYRVPKYPDFLLDIGLLLPLSLIVVAFCVWISNIFSGKRVSTFILGR